MKTIDELTISEQLIVKLSVEVTCLKSILVARGVMTNKEWNLIKVKALNEVEKFKKKTGIKSPEEKW